MKSFITNVVGVSFYQENVKMFACPDIGSYRLAREPLNDFDEFAIAVTVGEYMMGYIPARIAKSLAPEMDLGKHYQALFHKRMDGYSNTGFQIEVSENKREE